jgi:nucleotide-binding universal stress UspA family protein
VKRVLVGLDGSPGQTQVLEQALLLARPAGARLVLFRAVTLPRQLPQRALCASPDEVERILVDDARNQLEALIGHVPPDVPTAVRVDEGTPWRAILDAARAEDADLIVIGSHGYHGIDRILGTTAARVVDHADRSVLVVR